MAQQINLCTPLYQTQRLHFSALTMVRSLAMFVVLWAIFLVYWVWSLEQLGVQYQKSLAVNQKEVARLQAAIEKNKAASGPADAALLQEVQLRKAELVQRRQLLEDLRRGLVVNGQGHAARLQLVAQTIPAPVWLTSITANEGQLNLTGFTLEPSVLNDWMARLSVHPLLAGQKISAVRVERTAQREGAAVWSYALSSSAVATPVVPEAQP